MSTLVGWQSFQIAGTTKRDPNNFEAAAPSQAGNVITVNHGAVAGGPNYSAVQDALLYYRPIADLPGWTAPASDGTPTCMIQWEAESFTYEVNVLVSAFIGSVVDGWGLATLIRPATVTTVQGFAATWAGSGINTGGTLNGDTRLEGMRGSFTPCGKLDGVSTRNVLYGHSATRIDMNDWLLSRGREIADTVNVANLVYGLYVAKGPFVAVSASSVDITGLRFRGVPQ